MRLVLVLISIVCAQAADITGRWIAQVPTPGGDTREYVFGLKSDGDKLTGFASLPFGDEPIAEGKVAGEEVSFVISMRFGDQVRRMEYRGRVTGANTMMLTMPGFGRQQAREVEAKRVSTEPPKPPAPLPKVKLPEVRALPDNGLARTPPMGWNSWNHFRGKIDDKTVREIADAMVSSGMKKAGYVYVNIDDTWEGTRDGNGNIRTNQKFPDIKALADYVHSKGLKLGIYSSPGPKTCANYEGSYAHEDQDARTYAAWGIDYLKYDWCSARRVFQNSDMPAVYQKMGEALRAAGRPIVFSLCQYGLEHVERWGPAAGGNLWRTTGDIRDNWKSMSDIGFDKQSGLEKYAGPGHWNDPDMLEIGNGAMSDTEYRTHMSLWAILAAPLLAGNDLRNMTKETLDILTNTEVIAVNQDPLGKQGYRASRDGDAEVWARPLQGGDWAVGLFNRGDTPRKITARWKDIGAAPELRVRDLWAHEDRGPIKNEISAEVAPHGVVLVRARQTNLTYIH